MAISLNPLNCNYIIDGERMSQTPAEILSELSVGEGKEVLEDIHLCKETIADETLECSASEAKIENGDIPSVMEALAGLDAEIEIPLHDAESATKGKLAKSLIDKIWKEGNFCLEDLNIKAIWKWDGGEVGSMAALYKSVSAAAEYADALDLQFSGAECQTYKSHNVDFEICAADGAELSDCCKVAEQYSRESSNWLIYIPFDTAEFRIGASRVSKIAGGWNAAGPDIGDADYFIDCYEVVRELVEDGIIKSGASVWDGGIAAALGNMKGCGAKIWISDIIKAYDGEKAANILFGEIPGVLIEISDSDYDYVDAELLLQDIAYFPIGHPDANSSEITYELAEKGGIENILSSLMNIYSPEGED